MNQRVWIELDKPKDDIDAEEICLLANNMLHRLGDTAGHHFWWSKEHQRYNWGGTMGYLELPDRGHWFNLDYLGRAT